MCVETHGKDCQDAQYIKVPATKPDNLNSISKELNSFGRRGSTLASCPLTSIYNCVQEPRHVHAL